MSDKVIATVKVTRDGAPYRTIEGADISRQVAEIKHRNARTQYEQTELSVIKEVCWKIYGPDFDADEYEAARWHTEVTRVEITRTQEEQN